jgi:hypothetical protein
MEEIPGTGEKTELLSELDERLRNAVHDGRAGAARELINMGADPNCCVGGNPVVCLAAMAAVVADDNNDRISVVEALVEGGADLSLEDSTGRTALDWLRGSESEELEKLARRLKAPKKRR